jgi:hypothetical protein
MRLDFPSTREWLIAIGVSALALGLFCHDQLAQMAGVLDRGDPLFSMWRLAWVAHNIPSGTGILDANIFHPEPRTFLYSDGIFFSGLMATPLIKLGLALPYVYSTMILAGFLLNSLAMFALVRALTGNTLAANFAGLVFAFEPYRFSQYSHLEMQMTFWMPLALLFLLRVQAGGSTANGLALGGALVGQALSGLYCGAYFAVSLVPVIGLALIRAPRPARSASKALAYGLGVAALGALAVCWAYWGVQTTTGARSDEEIRAFSGRARDYLTPSRRSVAYGPRLLERQNGERELFPGVVPTAFAISSVMLPAHAVVVPAVAGLVLSVDASLGLNGATYRVLASLSPFRAFRVPARFRGVVGFYLALLAGIGMAGVLARLRRSWATWLFGVALTPLLIVDFMPRLELQDTWTRVPSVYGSLPRGAVVANLPSGDDTNWNDPIYMLWSTEAWPRLAGGYSGFEPPWYSALRRAAAEFPADATLDAYHRRGTQYFVLHSALYRSQYARVISEAEAQPRLRPVATYSWDEGEARVFQLLR